MLTQKKSFIEQYGIAIGVLVGVGLLAVVAGPALAQDLSDGVSSAMCLHVCRTRCAFL